MGKVLEKFQNGYAGAIARSLDDVVIALANASSAALSFGAPVVLNTAKTGVIPFASTHTGPDFVGITVRNPSKTPDTYGSGTGSYASHDLVDVLVRGHIVIPLSDSSAKMGDAVAVDKTSGTFALADETDTDLVTLPNVHISAIPDSRGMAEVVLTDRNLL